MREADHVRGAPLPYAVPIRRHIFAQRARSKPGAAVAGECRWLSTEIVDDCAAPDRGRRRPCRGWPQAAHGTAGQVAPAQGRAAARRRAGVCRALRCCPGRSGWHQRRRAKPQARGRGFFRPGAECQFGAALGASGVGRAGGWPQAAGATAGQVAPAQGRAAARRRAGVCRALRCCPGRSGWHSGGGRRHEHAAGGVSGRVRSVSSAWRSGRPG